METIVILGMIAGAGYLFLKRNIQQGAELVRAHIYLGGIQAGVSPSEANHVASFDVSAMPLSVIHTARGHVKSEYNGKQLSMIGEAYRLGLIPKLPSWYRTLTSLHSVSAGYRPAPPVAPEPTEMVATFELYLSEVIREAKILDKTPPGALHWIELVDHEGTQRAYNDRVPAQTLAKWILRVGPPGP